MSKFINTDKIAAILMNIQEWIYQWVLSVDTLIQVVSFAGLYFLANYLAKKFDQRVDKASSEYMLIERFDHWVEPLYPAIFLLLLTWLATLVGVAVEAPVYMFSIASSLLLAWIIIKLITGYVGHHKGAGVIGIIIWGIAALNILNLLDPLVTILNDTSMNVGEMKVTLFEVIWGIMSFFIFIWLALFAANVFEKRMKRIRSITPSAQVLIIKVIKIVLVSLAFLIGLNSLGIDLTALSVFGGALGVGLGFGLQKVVSNFISGIILLMDNSIKPGDVVQIEDTYGTINALNARYSSVITRDGTEYLIPNEDMITQTVINWSHSNTHVRQRVPIAVGYDTDVERAMEIIVEIANKYSRVLKDPPAQVRILAFGDNGIEMELRMWISDPENGVKNVASDILLDILLAFRKENIDLPFPQRVVHMAKDLK